MHKLKVIVSSFFLLIIIQLFTGCAVMEPFQVSNAAVGPKTRMDTKLGLLPLPKEPVVAAVYTFRDQTGQYKLSTTGSSFSTAVTQGATTILIKALEDSRWFVPIEREGLSDLLNERKIIRSSRENYLGSDGKKLPELPPLLYAGIILEGGIISYDTNVLTGGEGVKYLGISASGQYHQDRVSVYLRATSTQNGRILKTVYATKTVLSQQIDGGVYRFVSLNNLLQAEMGFTYNEPVDIAVTEAIQKAVESMVIEGVKDGLWQLKNPADSMGAAFRNDFKENKENENLDFMGRPVSKNIYRYSVTLNSGFQLYSGDYSNSEMNPQAGLRLRYQASPGFFLELNMGRGSLSSQNGFKIDFNYVDLRGVYYLLSGFNISPYILVGAGVLGRERITNPSNEYPVKLNYTNFPDFTWGGGIEYRMNQNIGISFELNNHYIFSDKLDGLANGKYHDYFWNGNLGVNFYFGN